MEASEELKLLLKAAGHSGQQLVIVSDGLWNRLLAETRDPFCEFKDTDRVAIWFRTRTMIVPESAVLNAAAFARAQNRGLVMDRQRISAGI